MRGEGWESETTRLRGEIATLTQAIGELSIGVKLLREAVKTLTEKIDKEKPK